MHILGIAGSLRAGSYNRRLLLAAARVVPAGATFEISPRLDVIPAYDEDVDTDAPPAAVTELRAAIARADAVLIATPEYNGSPPGHLKNALDWASRPYATSVLRGRPVAVVGASTGSSGAVHAQVELRRVLAATGARVLDGALAVGRAAEAFDASRGLADPVLAAKLREIVCDLVALAREAPLELTGGPDAHPRAAA
jgi:chromate reductase, NAD(P)H dehydrogenase (quinone)